MGVPLKALALTTADLPPAQIKQMEAVQRVLELEAAIDQLRLEKTDLSFRLKQELQRNGRAPDAGGPAASDTGSEVRLLDARALLWAFSCCISRPTHTVV